MREFLFAAILTFMLIYGYDLAGWAGIAIVALPVLLWNLRR